MQYILCFSGVRCIPLNYIFHVEFNVTEVADQKVCFKIVPLVVWCLQVVDLEKDEGETFTILTTSSALVHFFTYIPVNVSAPCLYFKRQQLILIEMTTLQYFVRLQISNQSAPGEGQVAFSLSTFQGTIVWSKGPQGARTNHV
jgi:hypothetical protein